ncbi:phage tail protein X [Sinorhizobium kostiense]|uniref:Phage tail protein X n=1 Tax=Sinorhizobium kostiense TaxID=76747 RepID=A0ABS4QV11_9HYPH|nr:LysM domain-containing protein [Sinorhizobium kostiense]MBP2233996.1 phage tail protein X [Sinorhizobium kostiense]
MRQLNPTAGFVAAALCVLAFPAAAQPCGKTEALATGETLEQLAGRCSTTVEAILSANPSLERNEIRAGLQLEMPAEAADDDWLDRARDAVREAGERVDEAARAAGRSVSDYLSDQPDLNRDLLEFGERLGLPGISPSPTKGAELVVASKGTAPGEEVSLEAWGLPGNAEVTVGVRIGDEPDFRTVSRAKTDQSGMLKVTIPVPEEARAGQEIAFVVETVNRRVRLVSDPFEIGS